MGIRQMLQQTEDAFLEVPLANSPNIQMTGGLRAKRRAARLRWTATQSNVKTLSSSATQSFLTQAETFPVPSDGCKCKRKLTLFPFLFFFPPLWLHIFQICRLKSSNLDTTEIRKIPSDQTFSEKHVR